LITAARLVLTAASALALAGSALAQPNARPSFEPPTVGVVSWRDMPFRRVVRQQYDYSCGSAAVATLLSYHYARPTTEADAFKAMYVKGDQAKIRQQGFSMLDMKGYLAERGLPADGYRMTLEALAKDKVPAIALVQNGRYKHFVVIKGIRDGVVVIGDPALGERTLPVAEFGKLWNGVVLAVHPDKAAGVFNHDADWEVRAAAPWRAGLDRLTVGDLTTQLAPIYQLSTLREVSGVGP
jgi:predicted double-glycine peptidase